MNTPTRPRDRRFDPDARFFARRDFLFNGFNVRKGQEFFPKKMGCPDRKLNQLYEQLKLEQVPKKGAVLLTPRAAAALRNKPALAPRASAPVPEQVVVQDPPPPAGTPPPAGPDDADKLAEVLIRRLRAGKDIKKSLLKKLTPSALARVEAVLEELKK